MSTAPTAALLLSDVPQQTSVEGYAVPYSVSPDETINFFVSSSVPFEVAFVRLTDMSDGQRNGTALIPVSQYPARFQRTHRNAWRDGCYWKCTFSLQVPSQWSSGFYAAECRWANGGVHHIVFIVRPRNGHQSDILVLANTNTWNAYNKWGGYSRYEPYDRDITATTFERPNPCASPLIENENDAGNAWVRTEICFLRWLRSALYEVDVISDHDFASGTVGLAAYRAIVLSTHPEYWTREMLDNLEAYLAQGGCLLYLGGNGIYEAVLYSHDGRHLVYHDGDTRLGLTRFPYLFRNLNPPRPERWILGVAFLQENFSAPPAPYQVTNAHHWIFAGTGVHNGDLIGQNGLHGAASGREMDTSRPGTVMANEVLTTRRWPVVYAILGSDRGMPPPNLVVLAEGTNQPLEGPHAAQITCYDTPPGGFVFSVGSMCFTGSLVVDTILQQIVRNALTEARQR